MHNNERRINELLHQLQDEDEFVRETAAYLLGEIAIEAWELFKDTKRDKATLIQTNALLADEIRSKVVDQLIKTLFDKNAWVRGNAADALGKIGDKRACKPLIAALRDEDKVVRVSAAEALGKLGDGDATRSLIKALEDEEWSVRFNAIKALGEIGNPLAYQALEQYTNDENRDVRIAALQAVEKIKRAVPLPGTIPAEQIRLK